MARRIGRQWQTHAFFRCTTCGKVWQDHLTSRTLARKHHQRTGHNVKGEIEIGVEYPLNLSLLERYEQAKAKRRKTLWLKKNGHL